jgi:ribosomal protein S18 acetylase RimI-like enzyme
VLRECERLARRWGQSAVYLHVEDSNEGARAFYEANGYTLHSEEAAWRGAFQKRKLLLRKGLETA